MKQIINARIDAGTKGRNRIKFKLINIKIINIAIITDVESKVIRFFFNATHANANEFFIIFLYYIYVATIIRKA